MRIKIIVDDWYLKNWWNIRQGGVYLVQEILYANKNNKKKRYVKGYKIRGRFTEEYLNGHNANGKFANVCINLNECEVVETLNK